MGYLKVTHEISRKSRPPLSFIKLPIGNFVIICFTSTIDIGTALCQQSPVITNINDFRYNRNWPHYNLQYINASTILHHLAAVVHLGCNACELTE